VTDEIQADAVAKGAAPGYLDAAKRLNKDWIEHEQDHYVYRQKPDGAYAFHRVERGYTRHSLFSRVALSARVLSAAWDLLERPFWPRAGNVVYKLPHEGAAVRWHQDIPYLYWSSGGHPGKGRPTTHEVPNFTTDIYLDPSNETNGCLYAIPGSHTRGTLDVDKLVADNGGELPAGAVALELEPGDVMFHHVAVVHGSPQNRSASRRRTFYVHYMNDATVADAYSDWPDLKSEPENMEFWGGALKERVAGVPDEGPGARRFQVTRAGLTPV